MAVFILCRDSATLPLLIIGQHLRAKVDKSAQAPSVGRRIRAGFAFENRKRYDPVSLVLHQDIKVGYVVVVKAGAKAVGTITHAKKAGMMGKLNMPLDYLITDLSK
jgi:hypothetical protein